MASIQCWILAIHTLEWWWWSVLIAGVWALTFHGGSVHYERVIGRVVLDLAIQWWWSVLIAGVWALTLHGGSVHYERVLFAYETNGLEVHHCVLNF